MGSGIAIRPRLNSKGDGMIRTAVAALVVLAGSFAAAEEKDKGKWDRCGEAKYHAIQADGMVIIVAYGKHRTGGYQVKLRRLPIEPFPPQFELLHKKPEGAAIQVITPFVVVSHFRATRDIKSFVVHDAKGKHKVAVTQIKEEE